MTLIFGINLSDRIYIAGDTRLTHRDGGVVQRKDQVIKVVPISKMVLAAFAGDAHMAAHIVCELRSIATELDIRAFRNEIKNLLGPIIDQYWVKNGHQASTTIILGGICPTRKKELNGKAIYDKVLSFSKMRGPNQSMGMKPALFNVVMRESGQPNRYPEPSDNHLFSVEIYPPNGFEITDTQWGDYLAYGPKGLTRDELNAEVFGMIEFQTGPIGKDSASITAILKDVAERRQEESVGGPFLTAVVADGVIAPILGEIGRIDILNMKNEFISKTWQDARGRFYSQGAGGQILKLTPLDKFKSFGDLQL